VSVNCPVASMRHVSAPNDRRFRRRGALTNPMSTTSNDDEPRRKHRRCNDLRDKL
jgi:hypothetical protein